MSLLAALASTLKRAVTYDDITANWGDINIIGPTASPSNNSNVTITFSSGGTRTLEVTASPTFDGTLEYRINSGSYISCPDGTTFAVSTGNTVNFRYTDGDFNESVTITVKDQTDANRTIDTFALSVTGY